MNFKLLNFELLNFELLNFELSEPSPHPHADEYFESEPQPQLDDEIFLLVPHIKHWYDLFSLNLTHPTILSDICRTIYYMFKILCGSDQYIDHRSNDMGKNILCRINIFHCMCRNKFLEILLVVLIICVAYMALCDQSDIVRSEHYDANYAPDTELLKIQNDVQNNYVGSLSSKYMTTSEFTEIVTNIKKIIVDQIIDFAEKCQTMNGTEYDKLQKHQMSLFCHNDATNIEETIVLAISDHIIKSVKNKYNNININPYQIISLFLVNANLTDSLIYPLMNSSLYTLHGIQYFTKNKVIDLVDRNIYLNDLLYTILSQRGIVVVMDDDQKIRQ
jgi:hypothetical protein